MQRQRLRRPPPGSPAVSGQQHTCNLSLLSSLPLHRTTAAEDPPPSPSFPSSTSSLSFSSLLPHTAAAAIVHAQAVMLKSQLPPPYAVSNAAFRTRRIPTDL